MLQQHPTLRLGARRCLLSWARALPGPTGRWPLPAGRACRPSWSRRPWPRALCHFLGGQRSSCCYLMLVLPGVCMHQHHCTLQLLGMPVLWCASASPTTSMLRRALYMCLNARELSHKHTTRWRSGLIGWRAEVNVAGYLGDWVSWGIRLGSRRCCCRLPGAASSSETSTQLQFHALSEGPSQARLPPRRLLCAQGRLLYIGLAGWAGAEPAALH